MNDRVRLYKRITDDLIAPSSCEEEIVGYPTDVYLTGILFPQNINIEDERVDLGHSEGSPDVEDTTQDEISLATVKRPATAGLSFVVKADSTPKINIVCSCGQYFKKDTKDGDAKDQNTFKRKEQIFEKHNVSLDFKNIDYDSVETEVDGLGVHIRTSPWGDNLLVTVAMMNIAAQTEEYERVHYEEICLFQCSLEITTGEDTVLIPRPLKASAIDEDTKMASLIYRNVNEYAVGHTCSAAWEEQDGHITSVKSTWLPSFTVKSMSSSGIREFKIIGNDQETPVLSTSWLSTANGTSLVAGLRLLPSIYLEWLDGQKLKTSDLDSDQKNQANKHFESAELVANRMLGSIKLIESDPVVEASFRLANKAIMLQRQWFIGDEDSILVWRPFQLAFILLSLESLVNPSHPDRKTADLLWFPTGGGKTESYLGLIAFLLFYRRYTYGEEGSGVAAIMRYTLRLLTVQQFQRAASLICACEYLRLGNGVPKGIPKLSSQTPFSLGLWVGGDTTPNNFEIAKKALSVDTAHNRPDQLKYCPVHISRKLQWIAQANTESIHAHCPDEDCLWHQSKAPLPVWTVDPDIYKTRPSLLIGTVDKFAQIARRAETSSLFGLPNLNRKPDLIIQDELHLISGPLGTLTGLYEVAIDELCSDDEGPAKVIASTATIRQASSQIKALFNRDTCLFPPPIVDFDNSGFAVEDIEAPGRLYIGVTTAGRSAKFSLQAVAASILQSAASSDITDEVRDDFWTLVTYFNSLRELGGALVLMQDDVTQSISEYAGRRGEEPREVREPLELTSRVSSTEIKEILDDLTIRWGEDGVCDTVLASNMISVGVDVPRLGTMVVNGQPKGIAEYIQATSRVGRRSDGPGGIVATIYNNAKARDRSHYETFNTWHGALYRSVEATSVTPFAPRAREKAIHAILVILARHLITPLNRSFKNIGKHELAVNNLISRITARVEEIDPEELDSSEEALESFLENWIAEDQFFKYYWNDKYPKRSLLISAERAAELQSKRRISWLRSKPTPNSMRNVEPSCKFKLRERQR